MKQSTELNLLIKALSDANTEISNPKNTALNPFYKSKYAPLDSILTMLRPIVTKNGLVIIQNVSTDDRFVSIETGIYHTSGQFIISDKLQMSAEKATAQGQGSAITYGRRYQLSAFLSIASEDDDDANHVSKKDEESEKKKGEITKAFEVIEKVKTKDELFKIEKFIAERLWTSEETNQLTFALAEKAKDKNII
jgi:hypothetical protein